MTSSKVHLRLYNGSYEIDRRLPTVLESNTNNYNRSPMTSDQWDQFCDTIDGNFRSTNTLVKSATYAKGCMLVCNVAYVALIYFYDAFAFNSIYSIVYLIASISLTVGFYVFLCFTWKPMEMKAIERARVFCQEETSRLSGAGISFILEYTPPKSGDGYEFDSERRQRFPNTYIEVSGPEVHAAAGGEDGVATAPFGDYYNASSPGPTDIENPKIPTATALPLVAVDAYPVASAPAKDVL